MNYPTCISASQRAFILENYKEILKAKSKIDVISVLNAIFYLVKTGCQWKMLPTEFPKWRTVYEFFRKWTSIGLLETLLNKLVELESTDMAEPVIAIIDGQRHDNCCIRNAASETGLKLSF